MTFHEATKVYLSAIEATRKKFSNSDKRRELVLLTQVIPAIGDMEMSDVYSFASGTSAEAFQRVDAAATTGEEWEARRDAMHAVVRYHFHKQF